MYSNQALVHRTKNRCRRLGEGGVDQSAPRWFCVIFVFESSLLVLVFRASWVMRTTAGETCVKVNDGHRPVGGYAFRRRGLHPRRCDALGGGLQRSPRADERPSSSLARLDAGRNETALYTTAGAALCILRSD